MKSAAALPFLWLSLFLFACNSPSSTSPLPPKPASPTVGFTPTPLRPTDTPTPPTPPFPSPPRPLPQYTLFAYLDYEASFFTVEADITYVNRTGEALSDLLLVVEPNRYLGGFSLKNLAWEDGQSISGYTLDGPTLILPLVQPLQPEGNLGLSISYQSNLPRQDAPFGRAARATNLSDWYPYFPPYIPGQGWLVRADAPYGEHLAYDVANFEVTVELANPLSAAGLPLTIAASAPAERAGDRYLYRLDAARSFAWTVSDQYQVLTTQVGDVAVLAYSFPYHPAADAPALETTARALSVYQQIFSPYPHKSLTVVEGDFLDGMEYDGLVFLSHAFYDYFTGTPENNLVIIAAHETAHQWWYGLVGNDQAQEPWLDEALSTYSESLFYEQAYPDLANWWWENRVYFHDPQGWVNETIYEADGFYPYRNAIYLRGALFFQELRKQLGEEAFFAFLRDYLNRYAYRQATTADFFALLSEYTSADLSELIDNYFINR